MYGAGWQIVTQTVNKTLFFRGWPQVLSGLEPSFLFKDVEFLYNTYETWAASLLDL